MEVSCSSTPQGNVYRFYRISRDFPRALKPVVPFLLACDADVLVGRVEGDPKLLIQLGPIGGDAEAELLRLIAPYLSTRCPCMPG
jgi:hypothetical protein